MIIPTPGRIVWYRPHARDGIITMDDSSGNDGPTQEQQPAG